MEKRKQLSLLVFLFVCLSITASAQSQVYGGYGAGTAVQLFGDFADAFINDITGEEQVESGSNGVFFAGYRTYLSKKFEIGGLITYENYESTYIDQTNGVEKEDDLAILGMMVEGKYNYLMKSKWKLYSAGMAGVGFGAGSGGGVGLAFHVDAIGFSYGNKVNAFLNLGAGFKGLVNLGVQIDL